MLSESWWFDKNLLGNRIMYATLNKFISWLSILLLFILKQKINNNIFIRTKVIQFTIKNCSAVFQFWFLKKIF